MAKAPRKYATLGPFVFSHPHLSSPDTEGVYADSKYKVDAVADPNAAAMIEAQSVLSDALEEFGLPAEGVQLPIKNEEIKQDDGQKLETGKLLLRTKSKFPPQISDASGTPIPADALVKLKIGPGSEGFVRGYFGAYKTTDKVRDKETGKVEVLQVEGVNFTLTGVQLIKLVQGTSTSSFSAYEGGGFTYEPTLDEAVAQSSSSTADNSDDGALDI